MNSVTFPRLNSYANFVLKKTRWSSLFHALIAWWWVEKWCVLVNKKAVTIHSCFWAEWQWKMTVPGLRCSDNKLALIVSYYCILYISPHCILLLHFIHCLDYEISRYSFDYPLLESWLALQQLGIICVLYTCKFWLANIFCLAEIHIQIR